MPITQERIVESEAGLSWSFWRNLCARASAAKFVRDVSVMTAANYTGAGLSFVQGLLVARWLGPEHYGIAALVMTYPSLMLSIFDARSSQASVRYLGEYHTCGRRESALAMCKLGYLVDLAVAGLALSVVMLTASFGARNFVQDAATTELIIIYAAALVPHALAGTSNAVLTTLGYFSIIAAVEIGCTVLRVALVLGLVRGGWQVAGVIWGNALASAASGLIYGTIAWGLTRRTWGRSVLQSDLSELWSERKQIFSFLAYNDLNALVATMPRQLDLLLLGYFRNPMEAGFYKLAKSFSSAADNLLGPLQSVTYAELSKLSARGDPLALVKKVRRLAFTIGFPLGGLALVGALFVPFVLPRLVGINYLPAVPATQLLVVASALSLAVFWMRPIYLARCLVRKLFIINLVVTLVFAVFYPLAVASWGFVGAACWYSMFYAAGIGVAALGLRGELPAKNLQC